MNTHGETVRLVPLNDSCNVRQSVISTMVFDRNHRAFYIKASINELLSAYLSICIEKWFLYAIINRLKEVDFFCERSLFL